MGGVEGLRAALADRYAVEREVGHGAMATVYLAHDLRFDRDVAVKVLSPDLSAALGAERFLREIDVVAKLNHPHILPLLDSGNTGGFLYYVMPYVDGGSLRGRLNQETQLRIDDAIALTREVALALDYAHQQGIVHRDVKPENILLSRGYALLGDFGIARVLSQIDVERLTQTGASPGTPSYMSPEQCGGGGGPLDGRSDLYSLGCVLYEMLAGNPPFQGPTAQAVTARHLADPVPPLRTVRRTVSEELERVVLQVLEKVPADRFATGAEFATALAAPSLSVPRRWWQRLPKWKAAAALVAVGLGAYVTVIAIPRFWTGLSAAGLDSTRYAILPFERDSGLASFNEDQLLQDAMVQWSGISVVDRPRMLEALPRSRARLTSGEAEAVARRVGAGRYVLSQVSHVDDSLRIHAAVYTATARGPPLHEGTIKVSRRPGQTGAAFSRLADQLLFHAPGPGDRLGTAFGTSSRPARQAFDVGLDSVYTWNLAAADSLFTSATSHDPQFAKAFLWLAQIRSWMARRRSWRDATTATWQSAAERAAASRAALPVEDQLVSDALLALTRGDVVRACNAWKRLTSSHAYDFAAWYSLANCLSRDDAVLRDRRSQTGWHFRSSYEQATQAYVRALQLLPSIHRSLRGGSFESVRRVLMTNAAMRRVGHALPPDTETFMVAPSWHGDTLAFFPGPPQQVVGPARQTSATTALAVRHQQRLFRDIATAWVTAFPSSADAVEALAVSLETMGDPAALDTIRRARTLAVTPEEKLRVQGAQVWMLIKFCTPASPDGLSEARALVDSALREFPPGVAAEPLLMASLAALVGRASLAAEYSRDRRVVIDWEIPPPIAPVAFPLVIYGALGGPRDSLIALERSFDSLSTTLSSVALEDARWSWLARAASLAFPETRMKAVTTLSEQVNAGDYLLNAEAAFASGDTTKARTFFHELQAARRFLPPAQITIDALYPESWLLSALGDDRGAMAWLDPVLTGIAATPPRAFADPVRAGSLVRALALRADLADRAGDRAGARRWARSVVILWSGADAFLQPVVQQLHRMTQ